MHLLDALDDDTVRLVGKALRSQNAALPLRFVCLRFLTVPGTVRGTDFHRSVFVRSVAMLKWAVGYLQYTMNEKKCRYAAEVGHLDVLKWARANDCPWNSTILKYAEISGHVELLEWARENGCPVSP